MAQWKQNNEISCFFQGMLTILAEMFAIFKIKLSFLTDILLQVLVKTIQKNCFMVLPICTFLSNVVHPLFASFPPGSKQQEKCALHPSIRDLAVGFWAGGKGRETVLPSFV